MSEVAKRRRIQTRSQPPIMTRMPAIIAEPTLEEELQVARNALTKAFEAIEIERKINAALTRQVSILEAAFILSHLSESKR